MPAAGSRPRPVSAIGQGSARVAAGLGGAGRLLAAARAAAGGAAVVGTPTGEQPATSAPVGGRGGAASRRGGTASRFGSTAGRFGGSGTARLGGSGTARLAGTRRGAVAAGVATATGGGGRVGDDQAEGNGTQDGNKRRKTHHQILLLRNWTKSQSFTTNPCTRPQPAGRLRATFDAGTLTGRAKKWVVEKNRGPKSRGKQPWSRFPAPTKARSASKGRPAPVPRPHPSPA